MGHPSRFLSLVLLAACTSASVPEPELQLRDLPATITLAVGGRQRVGDVVIQFNEVKNDSRCPTDVTCVWAGNAEVVLTLGPASGSGPSQPLVLNAGIEPRAGSVLGLSVTLLNLLPAPISTTPTRDYRAELRIAASP